MKKVVTKTVKNSWFRWSGRQLLTEHAEIDSTRWNMKLFNRERRGQGKRVFTSQGKLIIICHSIRGITINQGYLKSRPDGRTNGQPSGRSDTVTNQWLTRCSKCQSLFCNNNNGNFLTTIHKELQPTTLVVWICKRESRVITKEYLRGVWNELVSDTPLSHSLIATHGQQNR